MQTRYFIGLDLGQSKDYTAIAIIERIGALTPEPIYGAGPVDQSSPKEKTRFECRHLERVPLGTLYPAIVEKMVAMMEMPELKGQAQLIVDATGVGRPVVDMLRAACLSPTAVLITGGDTVSTDGIFTRVPKRELISTLQVLMQEDTTGGKKRLSYAKSLPLIETLTAEMMAFQVKITASANETYGAWREGTHDDLILAVALAVWKANQPAPIAAWFSD